MSLIRASPFFGAFAPELRSVFRMLDEPIGSAFGVGRVFHERPAVDLKETESAYSVVAELPGFAREDVKVEFTGDDGRTLVISAEHKTETKPAETTDGVSTTTQPTHWLSEISRQSFTRSFRLPHAVNLDEAKAKMSEGVLTLELPKTTKASPQAIAIE